MRLYEEYFRRHKISDVPLIHHNHRTSIAFKTRNQNAWDDILGQPIRTVVSHVPSAAILEVKWNHSDHHPGQYEGTVHIQNPDGHLKDKMFISYQVSNIKWSEYESFMYYFSKKLNKVEIAKTQDECFLIGWEMFVSCYDSYLNRQSGDFKYLLFQSLDDENSIDTRLDFITEILRRFSETNANLLRNWRYEVLNKVHSHADWYVNIIESHDKELLPSKN